MEKNPLVSVIIPTYKRPIYLKRAIESVINQTYENIEIIVVDDNNDADEYRIETEKLMYSINDKKVKYIKHSKNRNGAAARNTGIKYSSGKYIAFLDDDDEFLTNKILNQVKCMEKLDDEWGACYTSYKKINQGGKIQYGFEKREGNLYLEALMRSLYIGSGSNLFFKRKVIDDIGDFDESFLRNQDLEFLVRVLEKYKMAYVDTCSLLIHYEIRENKRTYEELEKIDDYYLFKFKDKINNLNKNDSKKVYSMVALENFRNSIYSGNVTKGLAKLVSEKVHPITIGKYLFYILNRYFTKKSYGFKM